ncbi:C-type mannose receptor 2 [Paramormyrops kingsleyae]|uniref:Mannose receptor C-type 2 n=1 Tax=Paramormyrops kingsleyae TaxID=1676925 RepID=A0A3B3QB31_9TELE|nr:C-type mannose receptor 2 [Paramormyrops kingsleyae]
MQRGDRHKHSPKAWKSCLRVYKCTLYLFVFSLELRTVVSEAKDPDVFAFYHEGAQACLGVHDGVLRTSASCSELAQQWKWVSRGRLYNLGGTACLGQATGEGVTTSLGMYSCDREPPRVRLGWHCKLVLESLSLYMPSGQAPNANASQDASRWESPEGQRWKLYKSEGDLCSKTYREIYTIQGNSHGRPCNLPFLYDGQWFHGCTSVGREDGHLWCATTYDYSKDERWGFCPINSEDCETFWDIDPVTKNCYQFNFQSVLSWNEARASCRQQKADLLSITEVHEQSYVSGLLTSYSASLWIGLNDLDINGGWQWADSGPFKYLNWEPDQPSHEGEENCVVIRTESLGRWQTRDCSVALPYICKKKELTGYEDVWKYEWMHSLAEGCTFGWMEFHSSCYRLNPRRLTWGEALKTCKKLSGNLVSIHTLEELEFIVHNLKKDLEELWIGLHDMHMQMNFEWSDYSPVRFTYWHPFEPNNFRNTQEDCVTMWGPEGRWNDSPCNLTLPSICMKGRTYDASEVLDENLEDVIDHNCKEGWHWYRPFCYIVMDELVTFDEARKACIKQEAILVPVTTSFQQAFLNRLMPRTTTYYWVSLQDQNGTNSFRWLSGDEVSYTNWHVDEPDYSKGGCVAMSTAASLGKWQVMNCNSTQAKYVCRMSLDSPLSPEPTAPHPTPSLTGTCPQGWKTSNTMHHCYKVFHFPQLEQRLSWLQAHLFCRKQSAQLVSVGGVNEEQFISQVLHETFGESEDHEQHWLWLGLNRRNPEDGGSWKWSDGLGYAYHNFGMHDLYEGNMHDCAMIDLGSMQWMTMQCESQLDWICKMPKGTVVKEPEEETSLKQWVQFQEAEYKFFDHRSTWFQALRICSWLDASLASVHTPEEQAFLTQTLRKMSKVEGQHWWMGLHTYENDGRFRWSDHSVLNYVSWAPGRPRPVSRDRKCVYITSSKDEWGDQKCTTDLPYICKRVNVTGIPPPTPHSPALTGGCPGGWAPLFGKCFKVFGHRDSQRVTWAGAKAQCEAQAGSLAVLSDHVEQAFLTTLLPNVSFSLWVGLSDIDVRFQWHDGTPLSFTNWAPGEPVAHRDPLLTKTRVNCVAVLHGNPDKMTGMWASRGCEAEKHGYVCQRRKDPTLPASPDSLPDLTAPLQFRDQSYQILNQRYDWAGALHTCNSRNASLATIYDPYQAAYLTMIMGILERPAWIGLYNNGRRSFTWLGADSLTYTDWWDGEPSTIVGCGHVTTMGRWAVVPCSTKMYAICQFNTGPPRDHEWSYSGHCPQALGNWDWVAFRNNCYSFNLERLMMHQEAHDTCRKVGAQMLSILDETENSFVWEHIQAYQEQASGAWLGISVNTKGGGLLWPESSVVQFTNWEVQEANLSMLSVKSCFWIQSNTGLWKPGSCKNRTYGMICKRQRGADFTDFLSDSGHLPTLVLVLVTALVLVLLLAIAGYLYRQRAAISRGSYEGARYSRTSTSPAGQAEKNILVSDMELNEQPE